ncbi:MAG: hypothetical protein CMJ18_15035 [Phycisphaeraceae bacterium]|nr:hypothetical protein [Phycisphaeraceae bacterium]
MFGRERESDARRAEQYRDWIALRSPYGLLSLMFGIIAVVDCITIVLGIGFGAAAVVTGIIGRRQLARRPGLRGHRLCTAGIALGISGVALSLAVWHWLA